MDKERRWVESSIHNTRGVIQANSDVFWIDKLIYNFSDHNEWNPMGSHQHWESSEFHWHKFFSFSPFNPEFLPGNRLIDIFPNHFSFHISNRSNSQDIKCHLRHLDNITIQASSDSHSVVVVSDASIKNQITTSISHIHSYNKPVIKTKHHAIRVTSMKVKLFAIKYGIIWATYLSNINWIIIITDSIHAAKKIFNSSVHPYQLQSVLISQDFREFFKKSDNYYIKFWDCPSSLEWCLEWYLHNIVDKEAGKFNLLPIFPCKSLWDFSKKSEYKSILKFWIMFFQVLMTKNIIF